MQEKLVFHFGGGRHASFPKKPVVKKITLQAPLKTHRYLIPSSIQPKPLLGLECPLLGQLGPLPGPMVGQEDFTRV